MNRRKKIERELLDPADEHQARAMAFHRGGPTRAPSALRGHWVGFSVRIVESGHKQAGAVTTDPSATGRAHACFHFSPLEAASPRGVISAR